MKSYLVFNPKYSSGMRSPNAMQSRWIFNLKWDFELTSQSLRALEMWNVWQFMQHIFGPDIVKYNDPDLNKEQNLDNIIQEFNTWFIKIALSIKSEKMLEDWDAKILNNKGKETLWDKSDNTKTNKSWIDQIVLRPKHVYSIEKFYKTQEWEYRVWIINPKNTAEKIDISLNQCKSLFTWQIIWFDIDKMFR